MNSGKVCACCLLLISVMLAKQYAPEKSHEHREKADSLMWGKFSLSAAAETVGRDFGTGVLGEKAVSALRREKRDDILETEGAASDDPVRAFTESTACAAGRTDRPGCYYMNECEKEYSMLYVLPECIRAADAEKAGKMKTAAETGQTGRTGGPQPYIKLKARGKYISRKDFI